jgi:hypothetical protein
MALQRAISGTALIGIGMLGAAAGAVPIVAGAGTQESLDMATVAKAVRVAIRPPHAV